MRRPAAIALGTILGSALLVGARVGTHPAGTESVATGPPADETAGADGAEPDRASPSVTVAVTSTPKPGATEDATTKPTKAPDGKTATTRPPDSGSTWASGTFVGAPVTHKYGTLQVTITISNGKINSISESYQTSLQLSEKINADALPKLRRSALAAQSADIDNVSGATYTSNAYRQSLQSALDKAD